MASETSICNRALQKLGAARITDLSEDSKNARECAAAYEPVRDAELRAHPWSFAVKRQTLAANNTTFEDASTAFTLPSDFLRLLPTREDRDLQIEGNAVVTQLEDSQLTIRYVARITDPNRFDALFVEIVAARLAVELNERMTQSNTKKQWLWQEYERNLRQARAVNAIERPPAIPATDPWIEARLT